MSLFYNLTQSCLNLDLKIIGLSGKLEITFKINGANFM